MRKNYVKPALISEEFIPQEYCGACKNAEGTTTYSASCDTSGYVFWDSNNNGIFDNGTDEYCNYNSAGTSCNFEINYHPGNKNAFCIPVSRGTDIFVNNYSDKVKDTYASLAIYGYRIEEKEYGYVKDSHFIANLNSETFRPNMS